MAESSGDPFRLQEDIKLGRKIATGGFGTVYRGELFDQDDKPSQVIVKKVRSAHGLGLGFRVYMPESLFDQDDKPSQVIVKKVRPPHACASSSEPYLRLHQPWPPPGAGSAAHAPVTCLASDSDPHRSK